MPQSDINRVERAAKPLINPRTIFARLPANAVGGVAEDLHTDLAAVAGVRMSDLCGLTIANNSGGGLFLRGVAAGAGVGVHQPDQTTEYYGWDSETGTGVAFMENAGNVDIIVHHL
jgi:hypothetical protein